MTALPFPVAAEPDPTALEVGRKLFAGETDFLKGVVAMDGLPPPDRVEVCFAGRSNVGKSTLLMQALAGIAANGGRSLYVTGEESAAQVALRANRLGGAGMDEVLEKPVAADALADLIVRRASVG